MAAPLHIHLDFISPYGYFASLRVEALAARHGRTVAWHPMLLGVAVLKVMGLKPLMDTPLKGDYVDRDVRRYAREHGLPMKILAADPQRDCARHDVSRLRRRILGQRIALRDGLSHGAPAP